jgi:predicted type IV restriction endonuclease
VTESAISREIQAFLRSLGFAVWSTEQGYRPDRGGTRTSAGVPDLIVIGHKRLLFVEVKGERGKLRPSQQAFRDECLVNGIPWALWRDVREAWDWCVTEGIIKEAA